MDANPLRRPLIAHELWRTYLVCAHGANPSFSPVADRLDAPRLAAAVEQDLAASAGVTDAAARQVVTAVTRTLSQHARERFNEVAERLCHKVGLELDLRVDADQLVLLAAAGHAAADLRPSTLAALPADPLVDELVALRGLGEFVHRHHSGQLQAELTQVAGAVDLDDPLTLDEVIADAARFGIDGESLCWAHIVFESNRHINLVWQQVNKMSRAYPGRTPEDLLGYGWRGLRTALRKYDPNTGWAFSTYAVTKIRGEVRDGVRAESPIPKRLGTFARKVSAADEQLSGALGRPPTLAELAQRVGTDLDALSIMPRLQAEASLDERLEQADDGGTSPRWLVDDTDPADLAEGALCRRDIAAALARLPEREALAVRLLVLEGVSPTEARQMTGATARQLRQWKERGLESLRTELVDWS
jgi:RNA polymerase sigma factor FliA